VNEYDESPMFIAVMRNYADVSEKLLEIPDSAHGGAYGYNALHAAVRSGNPGETAYRVRIYLFIYSI
jgi:ankyrin repeat protein